MLPLESYLRHFHEPINNGEIDELSGARVYGVSAHHMLSSSSYIGLYQAINCFI